MPTLALTTRAHDTVLNYLIDKVYLYDDGHFKDTV